MRKLKSMIQKDPPIGETPNGAAGKPRTRSVSRSLDRTTLSSTNYTDRYRGPSASTIRSRKPHETWNTTDPTQSDKERLKPNDRSKTDSGNTNPTHDTSKPDTDSDTENPDQTIDLPNQTTYSSDQELAMLEDNQTTEVVTLDNQQTENTTEAPGNHDTADGKTPEEEISSIEDAIKVFADLAGGPHENMGEVIGPTYETIRKRIDCFSNMILMKDLVPEFHERTTKASEDLGQEKIRLEHLARKAKLRTARKSSTLPLAVVEDLTFSSAYARNLSESERDRGEAVFGDQIDTNGVPSQSDNMANGPGCQIRTQVLSQPLETETEDLYEYDEEVNLAQKLSGIENRLQAIENGKTRTHSVEYNHAIGLLKKATTTADEANKTIKSDIAFIKAKTADLDNRVKAIELRPPPITQTSMETAVDLKVKELKGTILKELCDLIAQNPPSFISQLSSEVSVHRSLMDEKTNDILRELKQTTFKVNTLINSANSSPCPSPSLNQNYEHGTDGIRCQSAGGVSLGSRPASAQSLRGEEYTKRKLEKLIDKVQRVTQEEVPETADISDVRKHHNVTVPKLQKILESVNKAVQEYIKGVDFHPEFYQACLDASDAADNWIENVEHLYDQLDVHTVDNEKNRSNIEVSTFHGDHKQTVHEFIEEFETAYNNVGQSKRRATIMHKKCLSPWIKSQTLHVSNDYQMLKSWLIEQFGDAMTVIDTLVASLECAKRPSPNNPKDRLAYYLNISNIIMRIERLRTTSPIPPPDIDAHLYSRPVLERLISVVTDLDEPKLNDAIRAAGLDTRKPQGRYTFGVYKDFILAQVDNAQRAIERAAKAPNSSTSNVPQNQNKPKPKTTNNVTASTTTVSSGDHQMSPDSEDENAGHIPIVLTTTTGGNRWWKNGLAFPCPMVGHEHELNSCKEFFSLTPGERRSQALTSGRRVCWCCLRPTAICNKTCGRMINIPDALKCPECAIVANAKGIAPLNVLYCVRQEHDSKKPPPQLLVKELRKYLKGMPKMADDLLVYANFGFMALNASACGCLADSQCHHLKTHSSTLDPETDTPVFDTRTGEREYEESLEIPKEPEEDAFFLMQWIKIGPSVDCLVLFDRGSNVNLISGPLAEQAGLQVVSSKPSTIKVVGGEEVSAQYGKYRLTLGSKETGFHTLLCHGMPQVTTEFNKYPLHEINHELRATTEFVDPCDPLPPFVGGGQAHLIIGIQDVDLDPRFLTKLGTGIGVYRSPFVDKFGSNICYGGSHPVFSRTNLSQGNHATLAAMLIHGQRVLESYRTVHTKQALATEIAPILIDEIGDTWNTTPLTNKDILDLGCDIPQPEIGQVTYDSQLCATHKATIPISRMRQLIDQDDIGDTVAYRCPDCSACVNCKKSNKDVAMSFENSIGQQAIEKSVQIVDGKVWVDLPFITDPDESLTKKHSGPDNFKQAIRVYQGQCRKPDSIKEGMRAVHSELVEQGFISLLTDLPADVQKEIHSGKFLHYLPWRSVSKEDSPSTPLRMVVDPTMTGLNLCLPKGENNLGKMNDIIIATRATPYAWATDIRKMYNQLHLKPSSMRYQLMLYDSSLDPGIPPKVWVMTRAWYGMTNVGNQAGAAVTRLTMDHGKEFPHAVTSLSKRRFVDDVMSGGTTKAEREDQIEHSIQVLAKGGFSLKYIIRSGETPDAKASPDGVNVKLLGYKYTPITDVLSLGFQELNLNKKVRGAKKPNQTPITSRAEAAQLLDSVKITRRIAMSKLAEFYDPIGIFEPLKLQYKLQLSQLNDYDWDECLPLELQEEWKESLSRLMDLTELQVPRCVLPIDEQQKPIRLICLSDAGASAGGAVVYAGVRMENGQYTCGMVAAKSKLLDATIPRNELSAIMLMTELAFIVKRAIGDRVTEIVYGTDSAIALSWCHNKTIQLRLFVHNRVETIRRMIQWTMDTEEVPLYHIEGKRNVADLLTKKHKIQVSDVAAESEWQKGPDWMRRPTEQLPFTKYEEMNLSSKNKLDVNQECYDDPFFLSKDTTHHLLKRQCSQTESDIEETTDTNHPNTEPDLLANSAAVPPGPPKGKRIPFFIDLIGLGWFRAIRVLSRLLEFKEKIIHKALCKQEPNPKCQKCKRGCDDSFTQKAEQIVFQHETRMIKLTLAKSKIAKYSEVEGVFTWSGRLAEENPFRFRDLDAVPFLDAAQITGPVPVVMAESDVYFAFLMAVHTKIAPHAGVVTTMREVAKKMFIPNGPKRIIKKIRQDCTRCKILLKKTVELEMQKHNFARTMIAPPFYNTMMDIAYGFPGQPFKGARTRIKVYALVMVCILTGATSIQAMEGIETQDIVQALERHARMHGVPAEVFVDNGTQLKALEHATFNLRDVHAQVFDDMGMKVTISAAKSHEERGRVERRIGLIRDMIERVVDPSVPQTPLQWQTLFEKVANTIDDLPLAKGNQSNSVELGFEILTANRIKMGRNNNRSLEYPGITLDMSANLTGLLERNRKMYRAWYQSFIDNIHLLALKPDKWNTTSRTPVQDDTVLFVLSDGGYSKQARRWKLGRVVEVDKSRVKILAFQKNSRSDKPKSSVFERNIREVSILFSLDELYVNSKQYYQSVTNG